MMVEIRGNRMRLGIGPTPKVAILGENSTKLRPLRKKKIPNEII